MPTRSSPVTTSSPTARIISPPRFALNDACVKAKKPLVSAAVAGWSGQLMTVAPGGPCYRCLVHAEAPDADTCTATGVIGPLVGMVGSAQALEVLRVALGNPALADRLALFDGHTGAVRLVERSRDGDCPVCGFHTIRRACSAARFYFPCCSLRLPSRRTLPSSTRPACRSRAS
ncbi:MAG: ThiF family adenylyltransferase [Alphaproteobacteria bacterium]